MAQRCTSHAEWGKGCTNTLLKQQHQQTPAVVSHVLFTASSASAACGCCSSGNGSALQEGPQGFRSALETQPPTCLTRDCLFFTEALFLSFPSSLLPCLDFLSSSSSFKRSSCCRCFSSSSRASRSASLQQIKHISQSHHQKIGFTAIPAGPALESITPRPSRTIRSSPRTSLNRGRLATKGGKVGGDLPAKPRLCCHTVSAGQLLQ